MKKLIFFVSHHYFLIVIDTVVLFLLYYNFSKLIQDTSTLIVVIFLVLMFNLLIMDIKVFKWLKLGLDVEMYPSKLVTLEMITPYIKEELEKRAEDFLHICDKIDNLKFQLSSVQLEFDSIVASSNASNSENLKLLLSKLEPVNKQIAQNVLLLKQVQRVLIICKKDFFGAWDFFKALGALPDGFSDPGDFLNLIKAKREIQV